MSECVSKNWILSLTFIIRCKMNLLMLDLSQFKYKYQVRHNIQLLPSSVKPQLSWTEITLFSVILRHIVIVEDTVIVEVVVILSLLVIIVVADIIQGGTFERSIIYKVASHFNILNVFDYNSALLTLI